MSVHPALPRLVLSLADTKRVLGLRYSDWLLGAPSIEAGIAAASMAQDEWGHARLLYALLKDMGVDPMEVEHERAASAYASVPALDGPFENWAAFVAGVVIVDGALTAALDHLQQGGYAPASGRVAKMVTEEAFHGELGEAWFQRLAGGSPVAVERLREAVAHMMPSTLHALAPGDGGAQALAGGGHTPAPETLAQVIREKWLPWATLVDLPVPEWSWATGNAPQGWDDQRSRTEGEPDQDVVERARGDRNRALFVE
ncbi:MAG: Phenylacetic acid catabolic protein [Gemmatimonadota bacterium]